MDYAEVLAKVSMFSLMKRGELKKLARIAVDTPMRQAKSSPGRVIWMAAFSLLFQAGWR